LSDVGSGRVGEDLKRVGEVSAEAQEPKKGD